MGGITKPPVLPGGWEEKQVGGRDVSPRESLGSGDGTVIVRIHDPGSDHPGFCIQEISQWKIRYYLVPG